MGSDLATGAGGAAAIVLLICIRVCVRCGMNWLCSAICPTCGSDDDSEAPLIVERIPTVEELTAEDPPPTYETASSDVQSQDNSSNGVSGVSDNAADLAVSHGVANSNQADPRHIQDQAVRTTRANADTVIQIN